MLLQQVQVCRELSVPAQGSDVEDLRLKGGRVGRLDAGGEYKACWRAASDDDHQVSGVSVSRGPGRERRF